MSQRSPKLYSHAQWTLHFMVVQINSTSDLYSLPYIDTQIIFFLNGLFFLVITPHTLISYTLLDVTTSYDGRATMFTRYSTSSFICLFYYGKSNVNFIYQSAATLLCHLYHMLDIQLFLQPQFVYHNRHSFSYENYFFGLNANFTENIVSQTPS